MKLTKLRVILGLLVLLIVGLLVSGIEPERTPAPISPLAVHGNLGGPVLVVGGTRGTGLGIVRILRQRGDAVAVLARPTSNVMEIEKLGARVVRGNAMNPADLKAVFGAEKFVAVITTLGTTGKDRPRPDFDGNKNIFDAAKAAGVNRVLLVTVIGAGNSAGREPWIARQFLKEVTALKSQAEDYLQKSGLDYTIIRPGGLLKSGTPRGNTFLTEDTQAFSWIGRDDLAELVVRALDDPQTVDKIYHAHDASRTRFWAMMDGGRE